MAVEKETLWEKGGELTGGKKDVDPKTHVVERRCYIVSRLRAVSANTSPRNEIWVTKSVRDAIHANGRRVDPSGVYPT